MAKKKAVKKKVRKKAKRVAKKARKVARKVKRAVAGPSKMLRIAVTLPRPSDGMGPIAYGARMTSGMVSDFVPEPITVQKAMAELQKRGFKVSARGKMSISIRGTRAKFEREFGTELTEFEVDPGRGFSRVSSFFYPAEGAPWKPKSAIMQLIEDAYIQWPHIYMDDFFSSSVPSPLPPQVDYHHLRVPGDVTLLLNVDKIHRLGGSGEGVRVAMIDSGFAHGHAYFQHRGYNVSTVLAAGATDADQDGNGHGTGESANVLAVAPNVTFIGVKLDNESDPGEGASILEGFHEALRHDPDVISVSLGFDLSNRFTRRHLTALPNSLVALEAEIQAAVADGVVVVFSAGNGHVAFPGMMPEVISAGGAFVGADGSLRASDYASAFASKIYPGRNVPDFCGLVGLASNHADYIMLPIPAGCEIDQGNSAHDGTGPSDGWGVFSGTSAAAPQIAGLCALLLEKDPHLTPSDVKSVLRRTAVDVTSGNASAASNENTALRATSGPDGATGSGLVDAFAAWQQV